MPDQLGEDSVKDWREQAAVPVLLAAKEFLNNPTVEAARSLLKLIRTKLLDCLNISQLQIVMETREKAEAVLETYAPLVAEEGWR